MWGRRRLLFVVVSAVGFVAGVAPAVPGRSPAPAPAGWVVDRVRFEPLDTGAPVGVDGVGSYRGSVEVGRTGSGLAVVNDVGLEDYLRGVSEVPVRWPAEAQKAQAIAARTYALYELQSRVDTEARTAGADICATQACQVYAGLAKERRPGAAAWTAAVDATAGQVLLYQGKPILAKYSSTNGGRSVAGGRPYLRSVPDPDDAVSPYHRWQVTIPLPTLTAVFAPPGEVTAVARSGDTVVLGWEGADGTTGGHLVPAGDFRTRVNETVPADAGLPLTLPSARFTVATDGSAAILDGRGWGHGIGLSQYGALGKALRGMKAADILASYYAGLRPAALAPEQLPARIRVAVGLGLSGASVTAPGPFRVLDGQGHPLAVVASGSWRVVAAPGRGVRVVPPPNQAGPPAVQILGVDPTLPYVGAPARLRFRLSAPAAVRITLAPPGGAAAVVVDAGLRDTGDHSVAIPPPAAPGTVAGTLAADAGVARSASVHIAFRVVAVPAVASTGPATAWPRDNPLTGPAAVALLLLLVVSGWLLRVWARVD